MSTQGNGERRALSLRLPVWQSQARAPAIALSVIALATPLLAVTGGNIGTLVAGDYVCEVADTAGVSRGEHRPDEDFSVISATSYRAGGKLGSYLMTGDQVVLTSGPRKDEKYRRASRTTLVRLGDDGTETGLRCTASNRNNQ